MQQKVFVDTSSLILLSKINELDLLQLVYNTVYITEVIKKEFGEDLPEWIKIEAFNFDIHSRYDLDLGEASIFSNSMKFKDSLLIIDDAKARKVALQLKLKHTGTIGLIIIAKKLNYLIEIKPVLEKIKTTNFRLSNEIYAMALMLAGE